MEILLVPFTVGTRGIHRNISEVTARGVWANREIMPGSARLLDAPGVSHRLIIRGIERRMVFLGDADRDNLVERVVSAHLTLAG